ncbi:TIGR03085 family protein [Geodermatophilus telluris]|uniref:TIGR03085 family protein n=1 Tax=Geodermatophilus telluris TaxID=1190417 RepID=A0A1G6S164_9ACTN|nr:TIGR03085 family metal-binding protein [Geodermatophilus telluris]SDD10662.1 TIGR03085 family protein [Geodermatophilus telluris]
MTTSSRSLAARERAALADLLDALGPDAPTCCEGWTTAHLAAHLVTRDRRPDAGPGYALEKMPVGGALHAHATRLEDRLRASTPYPELVARVRSGPPRWLPTGWPGLGDVVNGVEFAVHHEDARRAQPGWEPRALPLADADTLWGAAQLFARTAAPRHPGGLVLQRSDVPGPGRRIRAGSSPTTVEGEPLEVLLWTSGRTDVARVAVRGGAPAE